MFKTRLLAASALLFSGLAGAQDWSGKGELGYVMVTGNTESEVLNVAAEVARNYNGWDNSVRFAAVSSENDGDKSGESYTLEGTTEYDLTERKYVFGNARYFEDRFDSFEEIYSIAGGMGYRAIKTEAMHWNVSVGLGYTHQKFEETGEDISGASFLVISNYSHSLTDTTDFTNDTRFEDTANNTFIQNIAGLSVAINSSLALKVGYEVRYNSNPAQADENTDTITSVNIVYKFK